MKALKQVLTIRELCSFLQVSRNTAYALIHSGEIKSFSVKGRYRIWEHDVIEYTQKNSSKLNMNE